VWGVGVSSVGRQHEQCAPEPTWDSAGEASPGRPGKHRSAPVERHLWNGDAAARTTPVPVDRGARELAACGRMDAPTEPPTGAARRLLVIRATHRCRLAVRNQPALHWAGVAGTVQRRSHLKTYSSLTRRAIYAGLDRHVLISMQASIDMS